ncbi:MAG: Gfo/Idh/MocA family oxidoreductase [Phycisphaerae bacterium]|nr:Gfo/Idh/MocA family oxidoreductase [Phycisphaerae bacterium]
MLNVAVVGCGGMSGGYRRAFEQLGSRVRVVAAVDVVQDRAKAAAEELGAEPATDYRTVLDGVDAVMLILPHHLHHPIAMECLAAGKHVLLEKPLAISEAECLDLIQASEKARRVLMIAYCMRFHPLVVRLKELIDNKTYGDVFQLSIWTEQHTRYPRDHWASKAATLGGGQLFSHGCHYIDLLLWFLGRPVEGTHMGTNYCTPWMEKEGTSNVAMKFESGALGYHFGTWGAKGTRLGYSFHAHCAEGMIEAHASIGKLFAHVGDKEELLEECELGKHVGNEIVHFIDCIETGRPPLTDARSSLQGLRAIWRLYDAEQKGVVADLRGLGLDES